MSYRASSITRLKLILTERCNFRCDYCFEGNKGGKLLDVAMAIDEGTRVLQEMQQPELTVLYFGGEPLLEFQNMRTITAMLAIRAEKLGKRVNFSVITNGSIMAPHILQHLKAYNYFCSVSWDGTRNYHRRVVGESDPQAKVWNTIRALQAQTAE